MSSDQAVLSDFFKTIWRKEKGYVYVALKNPTTAEWQRRFFEWPIDEQLVIQTVINERTSHEVYFAPSLFRERSSKKENVIGSFCFWLEFDGSLPVDFGEVPAPSMVVQTSTETHQHIYWMLDTLVEVDRIEHVNKSLAYQLGADVSGWDANQVLRPPQTLNHKKQLQAKLVTKSDRVLNSVAFSTNLTINLPPKIELKGPLPSLPEIVRKYQYSREVWDLFTKGVQFDRSAGLMKLGYYLAELNLNNVEILAMLLDADNRWGKFSKRDDQIKRLTEIVTRARLKYPYRTGDQPNDTQIITVGLKTLLSEEVKVEWMWDGLLIQGGYLLLTGPTGIGKSQLSLDFAAHLALGKEFLGRSIDRPRKTAFISLEMGVVELQYILANQSQKHTSQEHQQLEKMMRFERRGYPVYFNRLENKLLLEEMIQREGIECVIFDSLGSMTEQELSKETDAKNLMDWNDHLRAELGISTLIIHHHRKAQTGNKRPNSLSDIYGSHYFTARATTVIILWESRKEGIIEVNPRKVRMSAPIKPFGIKRNDDLTFETTSGKIEFIDDTVDITDEAVASNPTDAFEL